MSDNAKPLFSDGITLHQLNLEIDQTTALADNLVAGRLGMDLTGVDLIPLARERADHLRAIVEIDQQLSPFDLRVKDSRPLLALPKLHADGRRPDARDRTHVPELAAQVLEVLTDMTSPAEPYVVSHDVRAELERRYQIPRPSYWLAKSGPKEVPRWWKHVYDKAVERLDLVEGLVVRGETTSRKGVYALKSHLTIFNLHRRMNGAA